MKKIKNLAVMLLVLIALVSALAVPVAAATTDYTFFTTAPTDDFSRIPAKLKEDDSRVFVRVDSMPGEFIRVAAFGQTTTSTTCPYYMNLTYYAGGWAPFVRIPKKDENAVRATNYSVQSTIYENYTKIGNTAYKYGTLGFQSAGVGSESVSGYWSVDSSRNWATPDAP